MSKAETCVCCGRVIPEDSQYCVICGQKPKQRERQIDRIRNMSVEEMAQLLNRCDCDYPPYCKSPFGCGNLCLNCAKVWLESEVDTE